MGRKVNCRKIEYVVDSTTFIRTKIESTVVGTFLGWGNDYEEFESGPGNYTVAIVEMPNGNVETFHPTHIQFLSEEVKLEDHLHWVDTVQFDSTLTWPPGKRGCWT